MSSREQLFADIIRLRKTGVSLAELAKKFKLAKSTVSLWCRGTTLSSDARKKIKDNWFKNTTLARVKGTQRNRQKRVDNIREEYTKAQEMVGPVTERDLLIMGISLYWAEGSKKETGSGFSFINSDPVMIKVMYIWLKKIAHIAPEDIVVTLCVNVLHKKREGEILKFWSNLLDLPLGQFGNTSFIKVPMRRVYSNHENYFGMLRIKVKSSSGLRRRILGMIKVCSEHMPM